MRVRFWGVRGSVPWSTKQSVGYGGKTPCIEVRDEVSNELLILDAGTGLVGLAESLGPQPEPAPILLTHYHWDHVQGLPFFPPFFRSGWAPAVWAPALANVDRGAVEMLFEPPYFPMRFAHLASRASITLVEPGEMTIGSFQIRVLPLTHPGGAFAYRIRGRGPTRDLVYATDHEFGNTEIDAALAAFSINAGATILDAHFTPEELPAYAGWGHATWRQCAEFASATGAGHLWLFHHRPGRTDDEVGAIEGSARRIYPATSAAREGDTFLL
jgi:phosphoribosyl 1,2-cyclic phosphodiesterase